MPSQSSKTPSERSMISGSGSRDSNPNAAAKCSSNLECYLYSAPNVAERVQQGHFRTEREYRGRAAKAIAECERVFEKAK